MIRRTGGTVAKPTAALRREIPMPSRHLGPSPSSIFTSRPAPMAVLRCSKSDLTPKEKRHVELTKTAIGRFFTSLGFLNTMASVVLWVAVLTEPNGYSKYLLAPMKTWIFGGFEAGRWILRFELLFPIIFLGGKFILGKYIKNSIKRFKDVRGSRKDMGHLASAFAWGDERFGKMWPPGAIQAQLARLENEGVIETDGEGRLLRGPARGTPEFDEVEAIRAALRERE